MQELLKSLDMLDVLGIIFFVVIAIIYISGHIIIHLDENHGEKENRKFERKLERRERKAQREEERENRLENFPNWDFDKQSAFYKKKLNSLRRNYQGKIKGSFDDLDIELRAIVFSRPVNIILVDGDSGSIELCMKFINRRGTLILDYDEKKQSNVHKPRDKHWDSNDEEAVYVCSPGIYIEEPRDEIPNKIALIEDLSVSLRETMFAWLINKKTSRITVSEELIEVHLEHPFYLMQSPQKIFDETFILMNDIASHFSDGPAPIKSSGSSSRITCTYCGTPYTFDEEDPRCSSCGGISANA